MWDWCSGKETLEVHLNSNSAVLLIAPWDGNVAKGRSMIVFHSALRTSSGHPCPSFFSQGWLTRGQNECELSSNYVKSSWATLGIQVKGYSIKNFYCHFQRNNFTFPRFWKFRRMKKQFKWINSFSVFILSQWWLPC